MATVVRTADATSAKAGAKAVVTRDGEITRLSRRRLRSRLGEAASRGRGVLGSGEAKLIRVKPKEAVTGSRRRRRHGRCIPVPCPSGGTVELFIEPMLQAPRVVVMGASPVGAALVSLANAMGYRTLAACATSDDQAADARCWRLC